MIVSIEAILFIILFFLLCYPFDYKKEEIIE